MTQSETRLHLGIEHAYGGARRRFSIPGETLLRHAFVLGQTGVGKTTFLLNLASQLIERGAGLGFFDPHGDAAEALLELIPRRRTRDVVYLRPADIGRPIPYNPLAGVPFSERHQRAAAITEAVRALHADSWGDRLDWILYNSLRALLDAPETTLLDVPRLLVDAGFRERVVRAISDPAVLSYWRDEFASYDRAFRTVAVSPVQNKMGKLVAHPPLRAILGFSRSRLSFARVLDSRQLVIANLAGIGTHSANLLGSLYVSALMDEAMGRGVGERIEPFHLILDEAHRFTTESLATGLSEARKYNLSLVAADQFLSQTTEPIRDALLGNVGTLMSFRIGAGDAPFMERAFGKEVSGAQLTNLDPYRAWLTTLDGSEKVGPLKMATRPLEARHYGRAPIMREESRRRLCARQRSSESF